MAQTSRQATPEEVAAFKALDDMANAADNRTAQQIRNGELIPTMTEIGISLMTPVQHRRYMSEVMSRALGMLGISNGGAGKGSDG